MEKQRRAIIMGALSSARLLLASHTSLAMGQDANRIIARSDKTRGYPSIIYIKV